MKTPTDRGKTGFSRISFMDDPFTAACRGVKEPTSGPFNARDNVILARVCLPKLYTIFENKSTVVIFKAY